MTYAITGRGGIIERHATRSQRSAERAAKRAATERGESVVLCRVKRGQVLEELLEVEADPVAYDVSDGAMRPRLLCPDCNPSGKGVAMYAGETWHKASAVCASCGVRAFHINEVW